MLAQQERQIEARGNSLLAKANEIRAGNADLRDVVSKLRLERRLHNEFKTNLSERLAELTKQVAALEAQVASYTASLARSEEDGDAAAEEIAALKREVAAQRAEKCEIEEARDAARAEADQANAQLRAGVEEAQRRLAEATDALGAANELGAPAGHVSLADAGSSQHGICHLSNTSSALCGTLARRG